MPSRRITAVAATAAAVLATTVAVAGTASASPGRHALPDSAPHWLAKAKQTSSVAKSTNVDFTVVLGMRNAAGAKSLLQRVSDPRSASYGKWLTNAQFRAQFAPAKSDVAAVQSWLRSSGLKVENSLPSGMAIEASGSAAQVEKVFATSLKNYRYKGTTVSTNTSTLSLAASTPARVLSAVSGVFGLDQGSILKTPAKALPGPPPGSRYGVAPCSSYYGQKVATDKPPAYGKSQPYAVCGYGPQQYQGAYGEASLLAKGITGKGVTVAITDAYAAPTILEDAQQYSSAHSQPLFKPGQFNQITPKPNAYNMIGQCDAQGWYGEETLDVEAVHAMAPGAKVVYVGAKNCTNGLDMAWANAIDNHVADIITNSWTDGVDDLADLGQSYVDFYVQSSLEAALTGITVNFSSGDAGDNTSGGTDVASRTVEFPADLPYVTGVGGTSVEVGTNNQWLGEYGWQNAYSNLVNGAWTPAPPGDYSSGGGGGTSVLFEQPWYQKGVVPGSMSKYFGSTPMRTVPDISMPGDPNTGMRVGETQVFPDGTYWDQYRIGGTSLSSPLMAGVLAVANQYVGHPLGFVNPLYYQLSGSSALHDIVAPTSPVAQVRTNYVNAVDNSQGKAYILQTVDTQSSTIHSVPGYDDETGVGTPYGPRFFSALASAANGG